MRLSLSLEDSLYYHVDLEPSEPLSNHSVDRIKQVKPSLCVGFFPFSYTSSIQERTVVKSGTTVLFSYLYCIGVVASYHKRRENECLPAYLSLPGTFGVAIRLHENSRINL
ncbi:hypothetical protein MPTK1_4g09020 [Marchantia polymorpha subsp. ruderalis]|uniref:Uncharacterized protein n=2 Tax=Marchantia polymorpha TaxID=3197 RepID=A0AAF6B7Y3_MARPO|nr:hypothetical protein MARPO_0112s0004 [Marchantia polymorpha]BBN08117.1 hypothetical protein Mp_4g09020 [Marchantia polymorpha subsp. ruderalis]|eukprot:PTQ31343.1 hypothetical protein MARPO_0112s0004 [Marchantia polymorpha]